MRHLLSTLFFLTLAGFSQAQAKDLETVSNVDLNRYQGTWFEIAKLPNEFQKQCVGNTTARYTALENGEIDVVNTCTIANGSKDEAIGRARVADKNTNAKLKVTFVKVLGSWLFIGAGNYWVIALDSNYEWAVVGEPTRKYGWILARSSVLEKSVLQNISAELERQEYDPCQFVMTPHQDTRTIRAMSLCEAVH